MPENLSAEVERLKQENFKLSQGIGVNIPLELTLAQESITKLQEENDSLTAQLKRAQKSSASAAEEAEGDTSEKPKEKKGLFRRSSVKKDKKPEVRDKEKERSTTTSVAGVQPPQAPSKNSANRTAAWVQKSPLHIVPEGAVVAHAPSSQLDDGANIVTARSPKSVASSTTPAPDAENPIGPRNPSAVKRSQSLRAAQRPAAPTIDSRHMSYSPQSTSQPSPQPVQSADLSGECITLLRCNPDAYGGYSNPQRKSLAAPGKKDSAPMHEAHSSATLPRSFRPRSTGNTEGRRMTTV